MDMFGFNSPLVHRMRLCLNFDLNRARRHFILKVDNLTYRTTPEDLKRAFEKYGDVGDVYIPRDRFSRESRGFAFVRFFHNRDAEDAMESMDGAIVDGREMRVQLAKYGRPSEPPRRGPPRRRGSDRGRYAVTIISLVESPAS